VTDVPDHVLDIRGLSPQVRHEWVLALSRPAVPA
jgi:hypothetical protein